ncbi:MAG TPA: universal stress protein [Nitrospiraceae bacterium]|nr:universal stress protein [Nitrospiraceae bacterium]
MTEFGKILFPTDFSESAENASRYALSLAKKYGSKVYVIHVIEPFTYTTEFGLDFSAQLKEMEASARRLLDDVAASIKKNNLDVESVLITGEPFVEIIKYARKEQVDLIVMATHGRSGIEHMLMGSVAEKVVRKSPCPVLTIKKSGQTFTMP